MGAFDTLFDQRLDVTAPLSDDHLRALPAKRGNVLLLAEDDRPIVMLSAADLRARVKARLQNPDEEERRKLPDLRGITRGILWKLAGSHFEADLHFLELARAVWPETYAELLAWRPGIFMHVNPEDRYPVFSRAQDVGQRPGLYVGPFESGRSADRFIDSIQDAFDLCRDPRCLRQAPNAPRCSYGQMGKCVCVCDGTMSLDNYRQLVARAADFAAGRREAFKVELAAKMSAAAKALQFERASAVKAKIDRLAEFDKPDYQFVAPALEFRYLLIQPGPSSRAARCFLALGGTIAYAGSIAYSLDMHALAGMAELCQFVGNTGQAPSAPPPPQPFMVTAEAGEAANELQRWRMGLVAHYLYCSPQKRGVIRRCDASLSAEKIALAVEGSLDALHLKAPARPAKQG